MAKAAAVKTGKAIYKRRVSLSIGFGALAAAGAGYLAYKNYQKKKEEEESGVKKYLPRPVRSLFKKS
jgi:uncharacterized membrane protein YebE (DUF533 family)